MFFQDANDSVDIGDLDIEVGFMEYKETSASMCDTWRHIAGGFVIIALLVFYAFLLTYVLAMGRTDDEEATYAYLGTHM